MNATDLGMGKVFFLYCFDPDSNQLNYRFGSAREIAGYFHHECAMTPLPRRVEGDGENVWQVYVQHEHGSLVSTGVSVDATNAQDALGAYYDEFLLRVVNERSLSPTGKSLFLCEGQKGLLWLLDEKRRARLFKAYCPEAADSADSQTVLIEWLCYGVLTVADYMSVLTEVADHFPTLISDAQRVQLGMQIIELNRIFR